jgi:hypothetical protein
MPNSKFPKYLVPSETEQPAQDDSHQLQQQELEAESLVEQQLKFGRRKCNFNMPKF